MKNNSTSGQITRKAPSSRYTYIVSLLKTALPILGFTAWSGSQLVAQDYTIVTAGNNLVISDNLNIDEVIDMTQNGVNISFVVTPTSRTYSIDGGPITAFTTPADVALAGLNSITINASGGNDIIQVASFSSTLPSLTINGGTGDDAVYFNGDITFAADANLDADLQNDDVAPGIDAVYVAENTNLILSGTGSATVRVSRNVTIFNMGSIETVNGDLTVEANQQATPTAGQFKGIELNNDGVLKTSGTGALTTKGKGGDTGGDLYGVGISPGAQISGGTSAAVTVQGVGGTSTFNSIYGVHVSGTNSRITSSGGDVIVTGQGGGSGASFNNYGVYLASAGEIIAGGNGKVTVQGTGGATIFSQNHGVYLHNNSRITSSGGDVSVTGQGGGSGASGENYGVYVRSFSEITAASNGKVTVQGTGGAGTANFNQGVNVHDNSRITSSGGDVSVTGLGGGTDASGTNNGVYLVAAGEITAGGSGKVTVQGTGGATTGNFNFGVYIQSSGSRITSSGGDVHVTGQGGGSGTSASNHGVYVRYSGGEITAGGSGKVTVQGTGGAATGNSNYGVYVHDNSRITSSGGDVDVTGQGGGTGASANNYGVYVASTGEITAGSSGKVTVQGVGGESSGNSNIGVYAFSASSRITSSGGDVSVTGQGGGSGTSASNYGVYLASSGQVTAGGSGKVTVQGTGGATTGNTNHGAYVTGTNSRITSSGGDVSAMGQGGGSGTSASNYGVYLASSGQITAGGTGKVTIQGTGGATTGSGNHGVYVTGTNARIISSGGDVNVTGQGGGSGTSGSNYGIYVASTGQITAVGSGKVTVQGAGGVATGNTNHGVSVEGTSSRITSSGGDVSVTGQGGGTVASANNYGVYVFSAAEITAVGSGKVTVQGTGGAGLGNANHGVIVEGTSSRITSSGGDVSATGQGGGAGASANNYGVYVFSAGQITAGGSGKVTVQGTGGATTGNTNHGVLVSGTGFRITSSGGDVSVTGQGGGTVASANNYGVYVVSAGQITAGSSGKVTIQGTGGAGTGDGNFGVYVIGSNSRITSSGGDVDVTGQGGGTGASANNYGVYVFSAGQITAGGSGKVTIQGTGGATTSSNNHGVRVENANSRITSSGGDVRLTGIEGGGTSGIGFVNLASGTVTTATNGGHIRIQANSMNIGAALSTNTSSNVTLLPYTNGVAINLGAATDPIGGPLSLTDTELDFVTTGALLIGDAASGDIFISAAIALPAATDVELHSGGDIHFNAGFGTAGGNLLLDCGNAPKAIYPIFNGADTDLGAGTLSFGSDLSFAINGITPGDGSGNTHTQLQVVGAVDLTNTALVLGGSYTEMGGDQIILIDNDGADAVTGTFAGLAEGAFVSTGPFDNYPAKISYTGGTGNDVVLTVVAPDYTISTAGGNLVVTDEAGNSDGLSMLPAGANVVFNTTTARTYALNGGAILNFPVTINNVSAFSHITINQEEGDDQFQIGAFGGLRHLTINGGTGDDVVNFNGDITFASNANLDADLQNDDATPGVDAVNVAANANLILSGTGTATVRVSKRVLVNAGGSIETANGDLTVEANQQATPTAGSFAGIDLYGGILKTNGTGALAAKGTGGDSGDSQFGILVRSGGQISGGTSATVTVQGTGGATSGFFNYGVTVQGTNTRITSSGGDVSVTGQGGGLGASSQNNGVYVASGGEITAGGIGKVTVHGTGGATSGFANFGVFVFADDARISSSGGDVYVTGQGGGTGSSEQNHGVYVSLAGQITAGSSGKVTVQGTGGAGTSSNNHGVRVENANSRITSSGGDVSVTGQGGGMGSSSQNYGVLVVFAGQITAGGSGKVTVQGTGGATTGFDNDGVYVFSAGSFITSSGGDVHVTGIEGNGLFSSGFENLNGGAVTTATNGGHIRIQANSMNIGAAVSTNTSSSVTLLPYTNGVAIVLGAAPDPIGGPLGLTDTELDRITTGALHIGDANTGNITVGAAITRPAGTAINLRSGNAVNLNASALNSAGGNVTIDAVNGTNPNAAGNDVNTGAGNTLSFAAGNKLHITINGTAVDVQYDQLHVIGQVDITGVELEFDGSYTVAECETYTILNNDGADAVTGTFVGLPEGAILSNFRGSGLDAVLTYTGGDGNDVVITLPDVSPPVTVCPGAVTVTCSSQVPEVNPAEVTANDNCGPSTRSFVSDVTSNMTCADRKTITRTYRATDASGNSTTCAQVITVFDNVQPIFTFVPANVTVQCNSIPAVGNPTATDGCGGSVSIDYNGQTVSNILCTDKYTLTRQWTATDACGNTQTATQRIVVTDTQKPNFTNTPANVTVQCTAVPPVAAPTATDNCDATVVVTYNGQTTTAGACPNAYTLTRRWTASDNCNNTRSISQRITVVDSGKPVFTSFPANTTIACNAALPPVGSPAAYDGCGSATVTYLGQSTTSGNCPGNYQIRRTWRATDVCGNSTVSTQTIQVSDTGAPVFTTVPPPLTIQCNQPLPPLVHPTANDACGYASITFLGNVYSGSGCAADYTITRTWRAEDLCGNSATTSQVITVLGNSFGDPEPETLDRLRPMATQMTQIKHGFAQINQEEEKSVKIRVPSVLSVSHPAAFALQPNPTTDRIQLDLTDFAGESVMVSIHSDLGQLIWERRIPAVEELKLPISLREAGAAAGIYTVSVRSASGVVAKRVVLVE